MPPLRPDFRLRPALVRAPWLALFLLMSALVVPQGRAGTGVEAMASAMARMMDAMGMFGDAGRGGTPLPGLSAPSALPPVGAAELGRMFGQMPDTLQRMLPPMAGGGATALEGVWEGRDGGLLIVLGHRFRVQSAQGGYVDGLIQQRGERIAMYDPVGDSVRAYEFAEQEGRLVLRDGAGNVYLYRRLWLGLPDPFAGAAGAGPGSVQGPAPGLPQ